ncbi:MAG: 3'-5' exonuclease [Vampirovibrionales bacterium]|nr:3'-5' exonuclease [Vampirovibrionales bacterium]
MVFTESDALRQPPHTMAAVHAPNLPDNAPHDAVVSIDVETTGLDYKTEKIIEIAAVLIENGAITATYETLVNPQCRIRHSSFKVHGISEEMLADAPTMDAVLPDFLAFVGDRPIVAHNAIFDHSFINEACKAHLGQRFKNKRIDTFDLYRAVFPDEPSHGLAALATRFGVTQKDTHRALADAYTLAEVYPKLRKLYVQKLTWQFNQLDQVDYLLERYLRCQKLIQVLQAEMADLKEVFKLYFSEGGSSITASTGEELNSYSKRGYSYNDDLVLPVLIEAGLVKKAYKLNARSLDKLIENRNKVLTDEQRDALIEARTGLSESKSVQVTTPSKASLLPLPAPAATSAAPEAQGSLEPQEALETAPNPVADDNA